MKLKPALLLGGIGWVLTNSALASDVFQTLSTIQAKLQSQRASIPVDAAIPVGEELIVSGRAGMK